MREQICLFDDNPEYVAFVDKFVPKKTTDDCYTPTNVYEAVAGWVCREYGADRESFVRPFWPDTDFRTCDYPAGCVVVDNPPFSIRSAIIDFYRAEGIRFFLFSPALTLLTRHEDVCHIAVGIDIVYENGAKVPTSFVTNLDTCLLRTAPELYAAIDAANRANSTAKQLPRFLYPNEVVTAAIAQRWCSYGVDYRLERSGGTFIRALDAQRAQGKVIFGGGYLLGTEAAADLAEAERISRERAREKEREKERDAVAALGAGNGVVCWALSGRERRMAGYEADG